MLTANIYGAHTRLQVSLEEPERTLGPRRCFFVNMCIFCYFKSRYLS